MSGNVSGGRILRGAVQLGAGAKDSAQDTITQPPMSTSKVLTLGKGRRGSWIRPAAKSLALGSAALGLGAPV